MDRPKLRKVERYAETLEGDKVVILRDPLDLTDPVAVAAEFEAVLDLLDGSRTVTQIRQSLLMRGSHDIASQDLAAFVEGLGEEGYLDDDRFRARFDAILELFVEEEPRTPRAAGIFYPAEGIALTEALQQWLPDPEQRTTAGSNVRGVMVPHAAPSVSASVLDRTLRDLPPADELDLIVALGTDHMPGLLPFAVTGKRYATPLGAPPAAAETFEALRRRLPWIDREEIRHRGAVSLEIAALLAQWIYAESCPPILPILCGQTLLRSGVEGSAAMAERFAADLEALTEDRRVLWWGSAELSHAGRAYGRPELTDAARDEVRQRDRGLLSSLGAARDRELRRAASESFDQGRPSGGAVMAMLSQMLPPGYRMTIAAYDLAPAPGEQTGAIGLAGLRFTQAGWPD